MKFSIGYNEKKSFFDLLEKYKDNISGVYFVVPENLGPSGRSIQQNNDYEEQIEKLIKKCLEYSIETILTFNATCEGERTGDKQYLHDLIKYIKKLQKIGLNSISLTNLLYVRFIKKSIPNIKIYSSVNCYLKTLEQAVYFKKIGVDVLTIDRDINRDIKTIELIKKKTGLEIQVMLNEGCIKNCPYRNTHFNIISHNNEDNIRNQNNGKYNLIERFSCMPFLSENRRIIFKMPIIRPEDLNHYTDFVDYFKLVTRGLKTKKIETMINAYIDGYYHGNLFDIIDMSIIDYNHFVDYIDNDKLTKLNYFNEIKKCVGDCDLCNNCDKYF